MSRRELPEDLHSAYEWTDAAGELDDLRDLALTGARLDTYCRTSARNWRDNHGTGDAEVTEADLHRLAEWLREGGA